MEISRTNYGQVLNTDYRKSRVRLLYDYCLILAVLTMTVAFISQDNPASRSPLMYFSTMLLLPILFGTTIFWFNKIISLYKVVRSMGSWLNATEHRIVDLMYGYFIWKPTETVLFPETPHVVRIQNASVRSVFVGRNEIVTFPDHVGDDSLVSPVFTGNWVVIESHESPKRGIGFLTDSSLFNDAEELDKACKSGKWHRATRYGWINVFFGNVAFLLLWIGLCFFIAYTTWVFKDQVKMFNVNLATLLILARPHPLQLSLWKRSYHLVEMELVNLVTRNENPKIHTHTTNPIPIGEDEFVGIDLELRTIKFHRSEIQEVKVKGRSLIVTFENGDLRFENSSRKTARQAHTRLGW